jgi:hypothetical protein
MIKKATTTIEKEACISFIDNQKIASILKTYTLNFSKTLKSNSKPDSNYFFENFTSPTSEKSEIISILNFIKTLIEETGSQSIETLRIYFKPCYSLLEILLDLRSYSDFPQQPPHSPPEGHGDFPWDTNDEVLLGVLLEVIEGFLIARCDSYLVENEVEIVGIFEMLYRSMVGNFDIGLGEVGRRNEFEDCGVGVGEADRSDIVVRYSKMQADSKNRNFRQYQYFIVNAAMGALIKYANFAYFLSGSSWLSLRENFKEFFLSTDNLNFFLEANIKDNRIMKSFTN